MPTLGFDTATEVLTVAVAGGGEPVGRGRARPGRRTAARGTRRCCWPEIERCVAEGGGWEGIERIAVGLGPGLLHRPADRDRDRAGAGPGPANRAARRLHPVGARPRDRRAARRGRPAAAGGARRPAGPGLRRAARRRGWSRRQGPLVLSPQELGELAARARSRRVGGRGRGATISGGARGRRRHGRPSGGRGPQGRGAAHLRARGGGERRGRGTDRAHLSERARCKEMACKTR